MGGGDMVDSGMGLRRFDRGSSGGGAKSLGRSESREWGAEMAIDFSLSPLMRSSLSSLRRRWISGSCTANTALVFSSISAPF